MSRPARIARMQAYVFFASVAVVSGFGAAGPAAGAALPPAAPAAGYAGSAAVGPVWPLPGPPQLGRRFEPPQTAWGAGHRGVDLLAPAGTPVRAAASGLVTYAGVLAGRGVVTVSHPGGLRTTYEPVEATVKVGDAVVRGEAVGRLAGGHQSCPAGRTCLHWGLLRGSTYLDPLRWITPGRARLLALHAADRRALSAVESGRRAGSREAPAAAIQRPVQQRSDRTGGTVVAASLAASVAVSLAASAALARRTSR